MSVDQATWSFGALEAVDFVAFVASNLKGTEDLYNPVDSRAARNTVERQANCKEQAEGRQVPFPPTRYVLVNSYSVSSL